MNTPTLLSELAACVGAANVRPETTPDSLLPADWEARPLAIVSPGSTEEIRSCVEISEAASAAILPCGSGTQIQTGYPPRADRPYLLLCTNRLNRILDFQPDDLTITCEPGVNLAQLQAEMAPRRQFLALDVPLSAQATLGGIVSTNAAGFWRAAYGTPRDLLIGVHAIMTDGKQVKGGGKVVKNVAGYDVCKLFTGAWGTLGMITELTFRTRTLPEMEQVLLWETPNLATAAQVGHRLYQTRLAPTWLLATNELNGKPCLLLGVQGTRARTDWQREEFLRLTAEHGLSAASASPTVEEIGRLRDQQARLNASMPIAARIACLPTDLSTLVQRLETLSGLALTAHCATGILNLAATNSDPSFVSTVKSALPSGANIVWTRLPAALAGNADVAVWGEAREDAALQRALKQSLDPKNTFSPGRFLGRL